MPRPQKPLEEQLRLAQIELNKAEERVTYCKETIATIKKQIEDRDMKEAYALLKKNNVSVEELQVLLAKNNNHK